MPDISSIAPKTPSNDGSPGLVLIQELWRELQATGKDPVKNKTLVERIRKEADLFRQRDYPPKPES